MIYTLKEEIHIIILLMVYGIYIASYYDFIHILIKNIKSRFIKITVEIILWLAEIYTSYIFMYKVQDGYVPIYFIGFLLIGIMIYILFRKSTLTTFKNLALSIVKITNRLFKEINEVVYPYYLKEIVKTYKKRRKTKKEIDIITEK